MDFYGDHPHRPPNESTPTAAALVEVITAVEKNRLTGIGGWLLFFIILEGLSFFELTQRVFQGRPPIELVIFPQITDHLLPFSQGLQIATMVMALIIPCVLALLLLQKKIAQKAAIVMLGCQILISLCLYAFVHYNTAALANSTPIFPEMAEANIYQLFATMFISLESIFSTILVTRLLYNVGWIAYFCLSKRVRYTYGNQPRL